VGAEENKMGAHRLVRGEMMQRISRGEAEAVFHSGFTGGLPGQGAPDNSDHRVAIKPFFEGVSHYCVEDWHTLLLGLNVDEEHEGVTTELRGSW
jgi:hypothetical protein